MRLAFVAQVLKFYILSVHGGLSKNKLLVLTMGVPLDDNDDYPGGLRDADFNDLGFRMLQQSSQEKPQPLPFLRLDAVARRTNRPLSSPITSCDLGVASPQGKRQKAHSEDEDSDESTPAASDPHKKRQKAHSEDKDGVDCHEDEFDPLEDVVDAEAERVEEDFSDDEDDDASINPFR